MRSPRTARKAAAALTCTALLSATFFVGGPAATAAPAAPGTGTSDAVQGEQVGTPVVAPLPATRQAPAAGQLPAGQLPSGPATESGPVTEGATPAGGTIDRTNSQQITDVFNAINTFRATKGLQAVTFNATVSEMAEDWSDYMASSGNFEHNPGYYTDPRVEGRWTYAAEIIAGRPDHSGAGLVDQWIASPGHNAVMSDPNLTTIGVGIARLSDPDYLLGTVNFFNFAMPPAGTYATAAEFLNGGSEMSGPFADVPSGTQFADEINWLASQGISTGWKEANGTTTYRPVTPVNRDAMAAFMYRLVGEPPYSAPYYSWFADIAPGTQFYKEINWLAEYGISGGWDEGNGQYTYRPLTPVKRDAMAAFLYRLMGKPAFTPPATSPFVDVSTSNQFYKEITWLASLKISTGWDEGNGKFSYRPLNPVNRDAMAAFMYRLVTSQANG
ncbi:S-layer homology domain-containing protein [Arthrobacter sp. LjRoot14]